MWKQIVLGGSAAFLFASGALADGSAVTTGNLNIRSGPGVGFSVVGVIPQHDSVSVSGCVANTSWCAVNHDGIAGWSSASYLAMASDGSWWNGGLRSYQRDDLAFYSFAGRSPAAMSTAGYFTRNTARADFTGRTGTFASTAPDYGYGAYRYSGNNFGWGATDNQYRHGTINGQEAMVDSRNGALYLRR